MKLMNIKAFAIVALLSVTSIAFGYQYGISNLTGEALLIRAVERTITNSDKFEIIESLEKADFTFESAMCLKTLEYAPIAGELAKRVWNESNTHYSKFSPQINQRFKGKTLREIKAMVSTDVEAKNVFYWFTKTFPMANLEMKMTPNDVFKNAGKAATALVSGLDDLACKVTDIAMAASTGGASDVAKVVKEFASKPEKEVKDKKIDLANAKEELTETPGDSKAKEVAEKAAADLKAAEKVEQLTAFSKELLDLIFDEKAGGYKKESVAAANALVEKNKELLGPATFGTMALELKNGKGFAAMKALTGLINKTKESTTKTSIDDEAMVYGCSSCDVNTYMDVPKTDKDKDAGCSFGLGAIAKASAALTEQSLCQNRDFEILPTNAPAERVVRDAKTNAITNRYSLPLPFFGAVALTPKGG